MTEKTKNALKEICDVCFDEPMKAHTTFKVGGPCDCLALPSTVQEITDVVNFCNENGIKYVVLGKGSNVIFQDSGFSGVVILIGEKMNRISVGSEEITAEAGASMMAVANVAMKNGISGFEPLSGIPGFVGGAVRMNAGAYGGEVKDLLKRVFYIENGKLCQASADSLNLSYRHSVFCEDNNKIIVKAVFDGSKKLPKEEILATMNELAEKRKEKQPLEFPSAGSTFKRPEGYFAAKLIEDCGLKGYQIGGARVSEKHAGFVINAGGATASDVVDIVEYVKKIVFEKTGVNLEPEIEFI